MSHLAKITKDIQETLNKVGINTYTVPKEGVLVCQWKPYTIGGEPKGIFSREKFLVSSSKSDVVKKESLLQNKEVEELMPIITSLRIIRELFYIESIWSQLRRMAYKKSIAVLLSLLLSFIGISI